MTSAAPRDSIEKACSFLLEQAEVDFAEIRHTMVFPHAAGFTGRSEEQSSETFTRSVLARVLSDVGALGRVEHPLFRALPEIIEREAGRVAAARLTDREGGWSYFPDLPELPPDVDSLAAAALLFVRAAPQHIHLCARPIELVIGARRNDGGIGTWIFSATDQHSARQSMKRGVELYWGDTVDVEVCAHFYLALLAVDHRRYESLARKGAAYILSTQNDNGTWDAAWYWGLAYGTGLCLELLQSLGEGDESTRSAVGFFKNSQNSDGGWGWGGQGSVPLETALAATLISRSRVGMSKEGKHGAVDFLLESQSCDGSWEGSPWIKMEVGRTHGPAAHTLSYRSTTLTTAMCLRALLHLDGSAA
jgi:squalene-hopene/tetraprenyl-beta-curcumene cyclase